MDRKLWSLRLFFCPVALVNKKNLTLTQIYRSPRKSKPPRLGIGTKQIVVLVWPRIVVFL